MFFVVINRLNCSVLILSSSVLICDMLSSTTIVCWFAGMYYILLDSTYFNSRSRIDNCYL